MNPLSIFITAITLAASTAKAEQSYRAREKSWLMVILSGNSSESDLQENHSVEIPKQDVVPEIDLSNFRYEHQRSQNIRENYFFCWLIKHLQSFVTDAGFDATLFGEQTEWLISQLSHYNFRVETAPSSQTPTYEQVFANIMFKEMIDAVKILDKYSSRQTEQILLRNIIPLNLRLFSFFDSYGFPDPQVKGYQKSVPRPNSILKIWEGVFNDLEDVSGHVQLEFVKQLVAARSKLSLLTGYID